MSYNSRYVLDVIRALISNAGESSQKYSALRHMLVLPPGESIRIPLVDAFGQPPESNSKATTRSRYKFGNSAVKGPLPPCIAWPVDVPPMRAIAAERASGSGRQNARVPCRIHLFFGDDPKAIAALERLADDVDGIRGDFNIALFGDHPPFPHGVFFQSRQTLHDERVARLDSWLCTLHWWTWAWTECPFRVQPNIVIGNRTHATDRRDDAVTSKLAFSIFDTDPFAASAAILSLMLQFADLLPPLFWDADYPDVPRPNELCPQVVASMADHFVRCTTRFLQSHKSEKLHMACSHPVKAGSPAESKFWRELTAIGRSTNEAGAQIRRYGPPLARGLEQFGLDSTGVLSIVHCAGPSGGGPSYVMPTWEQCKVALQRDALRLTQWKGVSEELRKRRVDTLPERPGANVAHGKTDDPSKLHPAVTIDEMILRLEEMTPPFDRENGEWVSNTVAAKLDHVKARSLANYRRDGIANKSNNLGRDPSGRVWRRPGLDHSHPWYLRSSLRNA